MKTKRRKLSPLGLRVLREIRSRTWRVEDLASRSGCSDSVIRKLCDGRKKSVSLATAQALAGAFGWTVDQLIGGGVQ